MLTVTVKSEIDLDINQLIMYLDRKGISRLIDILEGLEYLGGQELLMTGNAGGYGLDEEGLERGDLLVNRLQIEFKPD